MHMIKDDNRDLEELDEEGLPAEDDAKDLAEPKEFSEKRDDHKNAAVPQAVAQSVEETARRGVLNRERFGAPHDDAVGDNQADVDRELFTQVVREGFDQLVDENNERGDNRHFDDHANRAGNIFPNEGDADVRERRNKRNGERHRKGGF